jgi:hypothetical protein
MKLRALLLVPAAIAVLLVLAGCTVSTRKSQNDKGENKDVDIRTPLGSISVHSGVTDAKDTGLSLYPGARPRADKQDDEQSANVNLSSSLFGAGLKVAVAKYQSDDPPDKVLSFYRKDMGRYGKVVDCTGKFTMNFRPGHRSGNQEVSCDNNGSESDYREQLKVGTENNQRIMAVKPSGKGSEFALVYVRARDEKEAN